MLAFDVGTRRTGVASGNTLTRTAHGLTTLDCTRGMPWSAIDALVADLAASRLLVGIPYNMDGTPTILTEVCPDLIGLGLVALDPVEEHETRRP